MMRIYLFVNRLGIDPWGGFKTIWLERAQVYRASCSLKFPSIAAVVSEQLGTLLQE